MEQKRKRIPLVAVIILGIAVLSSFAADWIAPFSADVMDSQAINLPPDGIHLLGTDFMGRDLFSMLLYGGRTSLWIGFLSGLVSFAIALVYGTVSGLAGERIDNLMMRFTELLLSIPSILLILFLQAIWGAGTSFSVAIVIGVTGWMNMAKVIRSEVRQIGKSDYILAAKLMEGSFPYIMLRHLLPNFVSSVMFMAVTNIGRAILTESTLSFLGLGLPLTVVSWGSLLSMSQDALLSGSWWLIVAPGLTLVTVLVCITEIGEYARKKNNRLYSNL